MKAEDARAFHCPRWGELPSIGLYMDQVILVLEDALGAFFCDEPAVTPAMVNNYVKQKLISAPIKKKYERRHLAALVVISLLKRVLSMPEIGGMIRLIAEEGGLESAYDAFCGELERLLARAYAPEGPETVPKGEGVARVMSAALIAWTGKLIVQDALRGPD